MIKCDITGCTHEVFIAGAICRLCRGGFYYWKKKRPAQVLERRRKLLMYRSRLEHFFDDKGKA